MRLFYLACAAIVALLLWFVLEERDRAVAARRRIEMLRSELGSARAQVQRETARADEVTARVTGGATAASAPAKANKAAPKAEPRPERASRRPWLSRVFVEHPQVHALYLDAYRAELEFTHAYALQRLGLSEEQKARVIDVLAKDMERMSDIAAATRANMLSGADPAIKAMEAQREAERVAGMKAVLGEQYADWNRFKVPPRLQTEAIMALHRTETPLTAAQITALQDTLTGPQSLSGTRRINGVYVTPTEADYGLLEAKIAEILGPGQMAVVRPMIRQEAAQEELSRLRSKR
ncbi:MAG: hypothetical protein V4773_07135 [Verrucomicrobiota bacterium]